jgi:putative glutamine amidotransferase
MVSLARSDATRPVASHRPAKRSSRPIVGVICGFDRSQDCYVTHEANVEVLYELGARPLLLTYVDDPSDDALWEVLDGVLLTGGQDCDPALYGARHHPAIKRDVPERDEFELQMIDQSLQRGVPTLGICRGMQMLNIAKGGTLYAHTRASLPQVRDHRDGTQLELPCHSVEIVPGTWLSHVVGAQTISVNSLHHQAVRELGGDIISSAVSPDGLIEAIEYPHHRFMVGVQWHPERMWRSDDTSRKILAAFVAATAEYAMQTLSKSASG